MPSLFEEKIFLSQGGASKNTKFFRPMEKVLQVTSKNRKKIRKKKQTKQWIRHLNLNRISRIILIKPRSKIVE
jgi:hypothetical protein